MTDLEGALQRIESIEIDIREVEQPRLRKAGAVDYSQLSDILEDPRARLTELLDRLLRTVSYYADVRTPAACTTMAWGGNVRSAVSFSAGSRSVMEHSVTVAQDISTRTQWLRILIATTGVVAAVTTAAAMPHKIPAALRAAWKLVAELEALLGATAA